MKSYREERSSANHFVFAVIAWADILVCLAVAVILFGPAVFGGFNSLAQAVYAALAFSIAASACLLVFRAKLTARDRTLLAAAAATVLIGAISPFVAALLRAR
jgi:hypothetical protein